jgi:hypothetical protein
MTREVTANEDEGPRQEWATPRLIADVLVAEFQLDLDVCALPHNAVIPRFIVAPDAPDAAKALAVGVDGLRSSWATLSPTKRVWCNNPYTCSDLWVEKALDEMLQGVFTLMLVPANTETRWFHRLARYCAIDFFQARLRFEPAPELAAWYAAKGKKLSGPGFPSMLARVDPSATVGDVGRFRRRCGKTGVLLED